MVGREKRTRKRNWGVWGTRACMLLLCGMGLSAVIDAHLGKRYYAAFRPVKAQVVSVSYRPLGQAGGYRDPQQLSTEAEVTVSFSFGGKRYTGTPQTSQGREALQRGQKITVYCNPKNPRELLLSKRDFPSLGKRVVLLAFFAFFFAILEWQWHVTKHGKRRKGKKARVR